MTSKAEGNLSEISPRSSSSSPCSVSTRNDSILRDQRIVAHLPLVRVIALQVQASMRMHVDIDDLTHAGVMGLIAAASKFDPAKEVAFPSYAKHRIRGAILDDLRQGDWASRDICKRHKEVAALRTEFLSRFQRAPTEQETAEKMGVDVERWRQMALELRMVGIVSITPWDENESTPEFPAPASTRPDKVVENSQLGSALQGAIRTLPARYQKVVSLYYTDQLTMKEIGKTLAINESRVCQIHKAALEKMGVALRASGVSSPLAFV